MREMVGSVRYFRQRLLNWYSRHRRDLPWRVRPDSPPGSLPDPYHVLLSEAMLQQTQVATVIPYFHRFIDRFKTIADLAAAEPQEILRMWQGLGYYSRARNLHACAKTVCTQFQGLIPSDVAALRKLPGIGRYTAGAIASLAYDTRAPILDGNVIRVLCRLDCIKENPRDRAVQERLWSRAEELLPSKRAGDFNSALMELGATLCTPKNPQCHTCPVRTHCSALAAGATDQIPAPRESRQAPLHHRIILCIQSAGKYLIEQRPPKGRWAGMWQFKTIDAAESMRNAITVQTIRESTGFQVRHLQKLGTIHHALSHRRYEFEIWHCDLIRKKVKSEIWATLPEFDALPKSRPQVQVMELLKQPRSGDKK